MRSNGGGLKDIQVALDLIRHLIERVVGRSVGIDVEKRSLDHIRIAYGIFEGIAVKRSFGGYESTFRDIGNPRGIRWHRFVLAYARTDLSRRAMELRSNSCSHLWRYSTIWSITGRQAWGAISAAGVLNIELA